MIEILRKPIRFLWASLKPSIEVCFYLLFFKAPGSIKSYRIRSVLYDARSRLQGLALIEGRCGISYIINTADKEIAKDVFIKGGFDQEKFEKAIEHLFQNKKLERGRENFLLDIGANIGTVCIPAIKNDIFQSALAVEADPHNARLLRANINLNGLEKAIKVVERAVSATANENLLFEKSKTNFGDHRVCGSDQEGLFSEAQREKILVQSTTIDQLFADAQIDKNRCVIWMDIQGHEGQALSGARNVLNQKPPMVIEFWPYGLKRNKGFEMLKQALSPYEYFIDINAGDAWVRRPLAELDELWGALGVNGNFTDLLLY